MMRAVGWRGYRINSLWRIGDMQLFRASTFLRRALLADAATCVASGLLLTLGADALGRLSGLPAGLLRYAGLSLFPFAAFLLYLATRESLAGWVVWAVIVLNVLWTADSLLLLFAGWAEPTAFGYAFVVLQALGVAAFAGLEYAGLRRSAAVPAV
jgi:hypothetical protein